MPSSQNKRTQIEVGSTLRARLVDVGKVPTEELMSTIGKLLDAAQDSGAGLGLSDSDMMMMRYYGGGVQQNSLVKFIVTNIGDIREKAYDHAVADARKRAERLARLNGVKLGAVLAVVGRGGHRTAHRTGRGVAGCEPAVTSSATASRGDFWVTRPSPTSTTPRLC